ncbi:hypothetical protein FS749_012226 [Ceratobasidium sp. UAMH 11750]|nr:hypothetical protein FS749_012226 [Ceratobasidium sp. UAMH 11750]
MSSSMHPRPTSSHSQPVLPSGYMSSSSSAGHGRYMRPTSRGRPSSYYSADTVNLAEAFADVNRALGSRPARQSMAARPSSQAGPSQALNTPSPPPHTRTLKKPQPTSDIPARMDASRSAEARRWEGGANPRFSIASEPAYIRPPVAPWEQLRVQDSSRRASFVEQSSTPRRPDLRIVIPGAPGGQRPQHRGQREVAGKGHRSAASKDRSGCVVM